MLGELIQKERRIARDVTNWYPEDNWIEEGEVSHRSKVGYEEE